MGLRILTSHDPINCLVWMGQNAARTRHAAPAIMQRRLSDTAFLCQQTFALFYLGLPQAPPAVSQSDSDDAFGTPSESLLTRNRSIFFSGDSGKEIALCHFDLKQTGDQWHEKFS